jgi:hypothetical protein
MIVDISKIKNILFRWAIGDSNTSSMSHFSTDGFVRFLRMAKTSILSFQRWFPKCRFVVFYNGDNLEFFKEAFKRTRPSLLKRVDIVDANEFKMLYHFKPDTGVWWKWIPFRYDEDRTEIHVDTDIICLSKPQSLIDQLETNLDVVLIADRCAYFSEEVCGNLYANEILTSERIPINCGFVALKKGIIFEDEFVEASKLVDYGASRHSYFLDEQGCFNIGLYEADIPFALLPRAQNIYATELIDRLRGGVDIELCHFISDTKELFHRTEDYIFRRIYDQNFTIDDFWQATRVKLTNALASGMYKVGASYGL